MCGERGAPNKIIEQPWQSCSCVGGWHYNTRIHEENGYKSASTIAKLLIDIVSKNGNLLLSVPLRADGTFDEKEEKILLEFGDWMSINKEVFMIHVLGLNSEKVLLPMPILPSMPKASTKELIHKLPDKKSASHKPRNTFMLPH